MPSRVRRALLRGLATDPAERWPAVEALLAELGRDNRSPLKRWGLGVITLALSAALLWLGVPLATAAIEAEARDAACQAKADAVGPTWDRWSTIRALASLPPHPPPLKMKLFEYVLPRHVWAVEGVRTTRKELCLSPTSILAAEWTQPWVDRCFARVAHDLELTARRVMRGEPVGVDLETEISGSSCTDFPTVYDAENEGFDDPATLERWRQLRGRLDDLRVAARSDDRTEVANGINMVASEARAFGMRAVERESLWILTAHYFAIGSPRRARASLDRAVEGERSPRAPSLGVNTRVLAHDIREGTRSGDARMSLATSLGGRDPRGSLDTGESLSDAIWSIGDQRGAYAELTWQDLGITMPEGYGSPLYYQIRGMNTSDARLLLLAGDFVLAKSHAVKGLEVAAMLPFVWTAEQSSLYLSLGRAELGLGNLDAAETALTEALRLSELTYVAAARRGQVLLALAELRLAEGELEAATRRLGEAEALAAEALADDERYGPMLDLVTGRLAARRGADGEARARFARARRDLIESTGFSRALLADADAELAALALRDGRADDAEEAIGEAMLIRRQIMGRDHITAAPLLELRARLHALRGEVTPAADDDARAAAIRAAWIDERQRRARACTPLVRMLPDLKSLEPAARATARALYAECGAAGVNGLSYNRLHFSLGNL